MRSIFARTYLDASILPTGFIDWNPARYDNYTVQAEYRDYGSGFNATARAAAKFDVQLNESSYAPYSSPEKVFQFQGTGKFGNTGWIDQGFC
jgi:outer membrane receptor for ferric coprogen and ferric-rhodotorulic acid